MPTASSLIIPTRNRPELLKATVSSVLEGRRVPSEIIVIDQSDPSVPAEATLSARNLGCEIRHVRSSSTGLSRARNEGIRLARHDLLVFLDDDMIVDARWCEALTGALFEAGRRTVVTGSVHAGQSENGGFVPATVTASGAASYEGRLATDVLAGGNMAAWRSAFDEVGLFDERLGAGSRWGSAEDNDFGFRLLEGGYQICYVPEALVYHRAWRPARDYYRLRWSYGVGKGAFYLKHASIRDRHMLRRGSTDIGRRLIGLPRRLITGRRRAVGDLVYITGLLWGAMGWALTESGRTRPPARLEVGP